VKTVITFGTFDVFHVGHLRMLQRAKALGDRLVVGVSTDKLNYEKKGRFPVYSESERIEIVSALGCVSATFLEESLEMKDMYIVKYSAERLVMGNDWDGKFDCYRDLCEVTYLERTPSLSTTEIIEKIRL
jgi:glycerol-3-phosphate cytidylyltransferase